MTTVYMTVDYVTVADTIYLLQLMSRLLLLSIAFIFIYSLLQTLSCVLLCYSEPELACLWPSKYNRIMPVTDRRGRQAAGVYQAFPTRQVLYTLAGGK